MTILADLEKMLDFGTLGGIRIVESSAMMISETRTVARTRRERWFSRPWRPWLKTKEIVTQVPNPEFIFVAATQTAYGHPVIVRRLREQLASFGGENVIRSQVPSPQ